MMEGLLAWLGSCAVGIGAGVGTYRLVLRPLGRHLYKRQRS